MKTTLNLDDDLMRATRDRARRDGVTLTVLVSDALREVLAEPAPANFRLCLPVTHGSRPPTVDNDSNAVVEEYLDRRERRSEPTWSPSTPTSSSAPTAPSSPCTTPRAAG